MDQEHNFAGLNPRELQYLNSVQEKIYYCSYDQTYDEGEVEWIFGNKIALKELLNDCKVPPKYWEHIVSHLVCPSCGHSNFKLVEAVGLQSNFDKEIEGHVEKANKIHGKQIKAFERHLEDKPMLGYQHPFGRKLFKEIQQESLPKTAIKGAFYRARTVKSAEVLTSKKMYSAPRGRPTEGRFNHSGQSHLYLANDKETALREVVSTEDPLIVWCQKFTIKTEVNNILDLTFNWSNLSVSTSTLLVSLKVNEAIFKSEGNSEFWRPDYLLTRYIMDCAKSAGYKGIKYNSIKSYSGYNLVLFYPNKINIKAVGNPFIELLPGIAKADDELSDIMQ